MLQLSYDGTFAGLLTVVFETYDRKISDVSIVKQDRVEAMAFAGDVFIASDQEKSRRVWKGLSAKLSQDSLKNMYWCFLSELKGIENTILEFCRYVFGSAKNVESDYGNTFVLSISQIARKVGREKHRFEAFVRFEQIGEAFFYAPVDPDFDVLPLILPHFKRRYADQSWIIYDTKRRYGIHYEKESGEVNEMVMDFSSVTETAGTGMIIDHEEEKYRQLWKNYFKSVNIPVRKNMKLHVKHIPKRYWKYLVEKK